MKKAEKPRSYRRWVLRIVFLSAALSAALSLLSGVALEGAGYAAAVSVLAAFILLGILFDIVGVAVTAADERPFHSMASHRAKGAREALRLIRSAEKVSSFCNDVVGDICGIVSGATAAVIVAELQRDFAFRDILASVALTALISGVTIGGKAIGKRFAIARSKEIVFRAGRLLHLLHIGKNKERHA